MGDSLRPQVQQFKNAFHMFKDPQWCGSAFQLEFSPQKTLRKDGGSHHTQSLFGQSPLSRHFKDISLSPSRSKQSLDGLGITVDDLGNFLLAEWRNNQIEGRYFLFKPNLVEEEDKNNSYSAICMYGSMRAGNLHGENYVYNITGSLARAVFEGNKITGKCHIIHSNKLFVADEANKLEKIECEVIVLNQQPKESSVVNSGSTLKVPKISVFPQRQAKNHSESARFPSIFEQVQANIFIKPNKFLQELITSHQTEPNDPLVYSHINQRQVFVGFIQLDKKQLKQPSRPISTSRLTGFGLILKNQWPISYGTYKQGKLQGLGRIYETEMNVFDGYFSNGELMQGFIIDYFANTTSFGHQSCIDPEYTAQSHEEHCFIITNTFETITSEYLTEYKKNFHLKSLNFNNSYFNSPKLVHRSPWPYNVINKLTKRGQIQSIIKSFRPTLRDMEISEIEKIGHSSQNRVEKLLIQEIREDNNNPSLVRDESLLERQHLLKQKSNFIKSEIQRNLEEMERGEKSGREKEINNYINQYQRLERRKTEIGIAQKEQYIEQKQKRIFHGNNNNNIPKIKIEISHHHLPINRSVSEHSQAPFPSSNARRGTSTYRQLQSQSHLHSKEEKQPPIPAPSASPSPIPTPSRNLPQTPPKQTHHSPDRQGQHDLTKLVEEYQQCQTARKNSVSGSSTRRTNTDRKPITPRQLQSKSELMQQDYLHFLGKDTGRSGGKVPSSTGKRRVDLDLIYRQCLKR